MGSRIGKYSYIKDIREGVITIGVFNSAWMNQLFMYKNNIEEKITDTPIYKEHNDEYFIECIENLRKKGIKLKLYH